MKYAFYFALAVIVALAIHPPIAGASVLWIEGEAAVQSVVQRHPSWYDKVDTNELAGGDFISNWSDKPGEMTYNVAAPAAGAYQFWVRANPTATKLSARINGGAWQAIDFAHAVGNTNIAADGKVDLRFIAWVDAGSVQLKKGKNVVDFRMDSDNHNHGMLDCFVLADEAFHPRGALKPEQMASEAAKDAAANDGWFAFDPKEDSFAKDAGLDLRSMNEAFAGEGGFIAAKGPQFVHSKTGQPVRFWAVNQAADAKDYDSAVPVAKMLAKHGVNLVRLHGGLYDRDGKLDPKQIQRILGIVDAMREQGIYVHLSIYFPLWMSPSPNNAFLQGYDGKTNPFAALYFNPDFQKQYYSWWTALLTTPSPRTNKKLIDEPAVFGCEAINEDSLFFYTFTDQKIPDAQMRPIEKLFGDWAAKKYGSIDKALAAWGTKTRRDNVAEGRLGMRPMWNIANERRPRDIDTVKFLAERQTAFYDDTAKFLRKTGFKGVITASNWTTASAQYLGPVEKLTYLPGDFLDRHGYFSNDHNGDNAAWSIRNGHTFFERSALRFDPETPGGKPAFSHPAFDTTYDDKPTTITETTWERPNRFRSEAPLYYAAYGSLQDTDAIFHFALDGKNWNVKPGFFMQPWTLMTPTMMGQFPAAAIVYRKSLISPGDVLVDVNLKIDDVLSLKGTPLPEGAAFDELRKKDIPAGVTQEMDQQIDPLVHLAGQTRVEFSDKPSSAKIGSLAKYIDRKAGVVTSTNGQLKLDYHAGLLLMSAPRVQGASGNLAAGKTIDLPDVKISSDLDLANVVLVSLDDKPIATSGRLLLQVMTEEKSTSFKTEPAGPLLKIIDIGRDPWLVRDVRGSVTLKRADAKSLKLTPLDFNGYRTSAKPIAGPIELQRDVVYYLIEK